MDAEEPMHVRILLEVDIPPGARSSDVHQTIETAAAMACLGLGLRVPTGGRVTVDEGSSAGTQVSYRVTRD